MIAIGNIEKGLEDRDIKNDYEARSMLISLLLPILIIAKMFLSYYFMLVGLKTGFFVSGTLR